MVAMVDRCILRLLFQREEFVLMRDSDGAWTPLNLSGNRKQPELFFFLRCIAVVLEIWMEFQKF